MTVPLPIALGAPDIYRAPDELRRTVGAVPMDVCAFVGVAPRGPVRIPEAPDACDGRGIYVDAAWPRRRSVAVPVYSWDEYLRLFGGFEGPGRLPFAVASFFEQGGRKAYVVRIVHDYGNATEDLAGCASTVLMSGSVSLGDFRLMARSEGVWGNQLRAALGYSLRAVQWQLRTSLLELEVESTLAVGSLLRIAIPAGADTVQYEWRVVSTLRRVAASDSYRVSWVATLDVAMSDMPFNVECVEGDLLLRDVSGTQERFDGLGLTPAHPRWLAKILYKESMLVYPDGSWLDAVITPMAGVSLPVSADAIYESKPALFSGGEDRYANIEHADFFDMFWAPGNDLPGVGVQSIAMLSDVSSLVVPDLYVPESLPEPDQGETVKSLANARFETCVQVPPVVIDTTQASHELSGLLLNPLDPGQLANIIDLQQSLQDFVEALRNCVVLIDVPPRLSQRQILRWRTAFDSSYVAAYHPWLWVARADDGRDSQVLLNPSAVAGGIVARQTLAFGVSHGPANIIARGVVNVLEQISPARHDELHPLGINVYLQQRDGVWLSAGRTLSRDPQFRQLSVRRLMLMLKRALQQQMHWMVFEPNGPALWSEVRHLLRNFLRQLYRGGAFKGAREEQAFFVRCDGELNTRRVLDAGQLLVEIGVAPAEPLEFIVVRITRAGDGTLTLES